MSVTLQKNIGSLILLGLCFLAATSPAAAQVKPSNRINQAVEQKLAQANEALLAGDLPRSEKILQEILTSAPRNSTAQTLAGILADRQNDLPKAAKYFAAAARLAPNLPETRNNYGAILLRLDRRAEAAKEFMASLALNPQQLSALVNLAQIRFAENDLRAAGDLFEKARAIQPDAEILRALVVIFARLGEKEKAKSSFQAYFAFPETTGEQRARAEVGALLLDAGLATEAVQELEAALAPNPSDVAVMILLSRAHLKQKNITAAGKLLESAVARGIRDAKIYAALSDVYQSGGYLENAIPAMRLAIEADPKNEQYRYRYAMLLIDSKAPPAAVIRMTEAVREFPDSPIIRLALGIAQYHDSKLQDARQNIVRALESNPRLVLGLTYLAFINLIEGKNAEAAEDYRRAIAVEEKNAVLHYFLADTLQKIAGADDREIEKHLRTAISLDADLGGAYLGLGRMYMRQKRFAEAVPLLEKSVRLDAQRSENYYLLAQAFARLKRADESKAMLDKFKQLSELEKTQKKTEYTELLRRMENVRF